MNRDNQTSAEAGAKASEFYIVAPWIYGYHTVGSKEQLRAEITKKFEDWKQNDEMNAPIEHPTMMEQFAQGKTIDELTDELWQERFTDEEQAIESFDMMETVAEHNDRMESRLTWTE